MLPELANNPGEGADAPEDPELAQDPELQKDPEVDPETGEPVTPPDDTEEIEREGQKYRIPKALKGEFLMQQDYTRKTQEVAEQRKAVEERDAALRQQAEMQAAHLQDTARVTALKDQIDQYEKVDWTALSQNNPEQAQQLWFAYMQLKDAHGKAAGELQTKVTKWREETAAQTAKRLNEGRAILQRDIKEWSPEYAGKLTEFAARELGFTPQEVASISDPRLIKVLHRAYQGDQAVKKSAAAKAAADKLKAQEGVTPALKVTGRADTNSIRPDTPASDKLSAEEWARRRNEQLAKRRA